MKPQKAELVSRVIGDHSRFGGHLSKPPAPDCVLTPIQLLGQLLEIPFMYANRMKERSFRRVGDRVSGAHH
ncbi:hypothetical protein YC2023_117969 [Brassica napus]